MLITSVALIICLFAFVCINGSDLVLFGQFALLVFRWGLLVLVFIWLVDLDCCCLFAWVLRLIGDCVDMNLVIALLFVAVLLLGLLIVLFVV